MKFNLLKYITASITAVTIFLFVIACNNESGNNSTTTATDSGASVSTMDPGTTPVDTSTGRTAGRTKKGKVSVAVAPEADANAKIEADKQGYYNRTEVLPAYKGGQNALENYITNNIQYPQEAVDNSMEGTVSVHFSVDEQGNISDVKAMGNKLGYGLEEEAVRVVSKMPKWTPGQVKGKNVKTWRTLPIAYKLES